MSNAIFPSLPGLLPSVVRIPTWKTLVRSAASGCELRSTLMGTPRWRYVLSFEFLREGRGNAELQQLVGLFNSCRGAWGTFLYLDPQDNAVSGAQFGVGDGVTSEFQLARPYGGFVEPIAALNGAPSIYKGGVLQATPGNYSVTPAGKVSFVVPPAPGVALTWTGSFYWRCRFLQDEMEHEKFLEGLFKANKVEFITVKGEQ